MTFRSLNIILLMAGALFWSACTDVDVKVISEPTTPGPTSPPGSPPNTATKTSTPVPQQPTPTATGPTVTPGAPTATPSPTATGGGGPPLGQVRCTLDAAESSLRINTQLLDKRIPNVRGTVDMNCGGVGPGTGEADCTVSAADIDDINVPGVGYVCVNFVSGLCSPGKIDCDGGAALDVDLLQDHNIGSCANNEACIPDCEAHCGTIDRSFFDSGCTGYCEGGSRDGQSCTTDEGCPDGSCVGKDDLEDPNICQCQCVVIGGNPGRIGSMLLNVGAQLNIEANAPCDGADVTITLPPLCIPLTTEEAKGLLIKADNDPAVEIGPFAKKGQPVTCDDYKAQRVTGLNIVAQISFFDSKIGDLEAEIDWTCQ